MVDFLAARAPAKLKKSGLPEPISRDEKARLMKEATMIEKARSFKPVNCHSFRNDNSIDG